MWEDEVLNVEEKPKAPSAFDDMLGKIESAEHQIVAATKMLDEIHARLEGPKPTAAETARDSESHNSLLGKIADRLSGMDASASDVLRAARQLNDIIR